MEKDLNSVSLSLEMVWKLQLVQNVAVQLVTEI